MLDSGQRGFRFCGLLCQFLLLGEPGGFGLLLLHKGVVGLALLVQANYLCLFGSHFIVAQRLVGLYLLFGLLPFLLVFFGHVEDALAYARVDAGTCYLLQNVGLVIVLAVEKTCELPLGKHRGAAELLEVKSDGLPYLGFYLLVLIISNVAEHVLERPLLGLQIAVGLVP